MTVRRNHPNVYDLEDLTNRVQSDSALQWQDIAPIFRDVSARYKQRIYAIPLDGDFHMVYYRSDLLKTAGLEPPTTWDDYLAIAKQFHGKDLNNDGTPDYGSCMAKGPRFAGYLLFTSITSSWLQSQGTTQGGFFDLETMKPLVRNPAFAKALDIYKKTMDFGLPNEANLDGYEQDAFTRCQGKYLRHFISDRRHYRTSPSTRRTQTTKTKSRRSTSRTSRRPSAIGAK
nr:extracellular solute-binding protein [Nostoc sp. DedQUE07]MDZ8131370.1 extracellular solute-binding protein [Nostoc sp. DedQUE07]